MSQHLLEEFIQSGDAGALSELLNSKPSLAEIKTSQNISPLMLSCYYQKKDVSKVILQHLSELTLFEASATGDSARVSAILSENPELLNSFSADGFTPLSLAAYFGNEDVARELLRRGADPNIPSQNGFHVYPIHSAVAANHTIIAKMLLEAGADINVVQTSGGTPLHSAAHNGNVDLLIVLLEAGANVHAQMEDGKTPADKATEKGFKDIAKILS